MIVGSVKWKGKAGLRSCSEVMLGMNLRKASNVRRPPAGLSPKDESSRAWVVKPFMVADVW